MASAAESVPSLLRQGIEHHHAGQLALAEQCYRRVLAEAPNDPDGLHLLGLVAHQCGKTDVAVRYLARAIRLNPHATHFYRNLANVLCGAGRPRQAVTCLRAIVALEPASEKAWRDLAGALQQTGDLNGAEASLRRAIELVQCSVEAHNDLGVVLAEAGRLEQAEACYHEALRLRPDYAFAHNNLGNLLRMRGRFEAAEASLRTALRVQPDYVNAHNNLGNVLSDLGRVAEAETCYRTALALDATHAEAHYNLGAALLLGGRLAEGWEGYEWRWRRRGFTQRAFQQPRWAGEALGDRVLLVHAEQGYGDTIQFCRYLPRLGQGVRVFLEAPKPLLRLLQGIGGIERLVQAGQPLPAFDVHCALPSLPCVLGTTLDSIPAEVPYLKADRAVTEAWRERLAGSGGLKVGLVWAGNSMHPLDARRSIKPEKLDVLASVPGVTFVSLQYGARARPGLKLLDWTDELPDFAATAALVMALDLVISVDTSVVHLAGALGKPVWLLNRLDTCWRWLLDRADSPWYPTLRQFRQRRPGDWDGVLGEVAEALRGVATDGVGLLGSDCNKSKNRDAP
jgi:Flp pilus assembly protein TadD